MDRKCLNQPRSPLQNYRYLKKSKAKIGIAMGLRLALAKAYHAVDLNKPRTTARK